MKYHSSSDVISAFKEAIHARLGIAPSRINADGKRHRFSANGKPKDEAGWYILHLDNKPAGAFGSWRGDINERWTFKGGLEPLDEKQREALRKEQALRQKREANTQQALADRARKVANSLWRKAGADARTHPYIIKKQINPYGIKAIDSNLVANIMATEGMKMILPASQTLLLIPMYSLADKQLVMTSLQWIDQDGSKRFLSGTQKRGLFFSFGGQLSDVKNIDVVEGFATGASVHEFRGNVTLCAFDSGNLLPVVERILDSFPDLTITIIADNDRKTSIDKPELGNVGIDKAKKVKVAFPQVLLLTPQFPEDAPIELSDFNDLCVYLKNNTK